MTLRLALADGQVVPLLAREVVPCRWQNCPPAGPMRVRNDSSRRHRFPSGYRLRATAHRCWQRSRTAEIRPINVAEARFALVRSGTTLRRPLTRCGDLRSLTALATSTERGDRRQPRGEEQRHATPTRFGMLDGVR